MLRLFYGKMPGLLAVIRCKKKAVTPANRWFSTIIDLTRPKTVGIRPYSTLQTPKPSVYPHVRPVKPQNQRYTGIFKPLHPQTDGLLPGRFPQKRIPRAPGVKALNRYSFRASRKHCCGGSCVLARRQFGTSF